MEIYASGFESQINEEVKPMQEDIVIVKIVYNHTIGNAFTLLIF